MHPFASFEVARVHHAQSCLATWATRMHWCAAATVHADVVPPEVLAILVGDHVAVADAHAFAALLADLPKIVAHSCALTIARKADQLFFWFFFAERRNIS